MKNKIKNTLLLGMALVGFASFANAQCDDCEYEHKLEKPKTQVVEEEEVTPPQTVQEFSGCPDNALKQKHIIFVHGLGGSSNSWDKPAVWTGKTYKTAKTLVNYEAELQSSFNYVAEKINNQIHSFAESTVNQSFPTRCKLDDFVIAHSQGGIAARYLDMAWDKLNDDGDYGNRKFYGLVTFGTPHSGAYIALTQDQHNEFVQQVVSSVILFDGQKKIYDATEKFGYLIGSSLFDVKNGMDSLIKNKLAPVMLSSVHTNTLDEMAPKSITMNELNKHQSALRKVAFYGIESAPECWKVLDNFDTKAAEDYDLFKANNDKTFQEKMEKVRAHHLAKLSDHRKSIKKLEANLNAPLWGLIRIVIGGKKKLRSLRVMVQHREATVRFLNNANTEWRYLIGSYQPGVTNKTETRYVAKAELRFGIELKKSFTVRQEAEAWLLKLPTDLGPSAIKSTSIHQTTIFVGNTLLFFPSDGVVLTKSQKAFPGVKNRIDKMPGDNHFQERNSNNTERVLIKLYNGDYDTFFITEKQ